MISGPLFVDIGFSQRCKRGENICGDAFKFCRVPEENRIILVLSDGLGSGIKANILSSMTSTMALKFMASNKEILQSAETIMSALPICRIRKISYATFTIVDLALNGRTKIINMGNPPFLFMHKGKCVKIPCSEICSPNWRDRSIEVYEFEVSEGDRIVLISDGITQAGMGTEKYKLGWRLEGCRKFVENRADEEDNRGSQDFAEALIKEALLKENSYTPGDDMSSASIYFRKPEKLILFTGPPFFKERDTECARLIASYGGSRVICGGTTANIVARELNREIKTDLKSARYDLPPVSGMNGIDLITEGIFTLTRTAKYLEEGIPPGTGDPAAMLAEILRKNDIIEMLVGTRINEVHQDPNLPLDIEIRRSIVRRIANVLKEKYLKEVKIKFV